MRLADRNNDGDQNENTAQHSSAKPERLRYVGEDTGQQHFAVHLAGNSEFLVFFFSFFFSNVV